MIFSHIIILKKYLIKIFLKNYFIKIFTCHILRALFYITERDRTVSMGEEFTCK